MTVSCCSVASVRRSATMPRAARKKTKLELFNVVVIAEYAGKVVEDGAGNEEEETATDQGRVG